jgi:hypothetical protein
MAGLALVMTLLCACGAKVVGSSAPTTAVSTTGPTTVPATTLSTLPGGCVNGVVTDALRSQLVLANGSPGGQAVPGDTYYGVCGATSYAVARFEPAPGATLQEQVSFQDDGSGPRFFVEQAGGSWTVAGIEPYEQLPSCSGFTQLPSSLKTLWDNCPLG